eukprot:2254267-Amphidinium_carterae.1
MLQGAKLSISFTYCKLSLSLNIEYWELRKKGKSPMFERRGRSSAVYCWVLKGAEGVQRAEG